MQMFLAPLFLWTAFAPPENALKDFAVLQRTGVNATLDLVITISGTKPSRWWDKTHELGIFLQEKAHPERVTMLSADSGPPECGLRIERVTASETVIACEVEKGGRDTNQKYTYDVRTRKLLGKITYRPFAMYRAFETATRVVAVGSDTERLVAVEFDSNRTPALRILGEKEALPWLNRVPATRLLEGSRRVVYIERVKQPPPPIPPLPRSRLDKAKYRNVDDSIGPWKKEGELIWFAKNFYDGEGTTGVGGFGYFDLQNRKLHLLQPPEILRWSVSAMNVAPDAVWLALAHNGEYGGDGGGLLRYDRESGEVQRFPSKDITTQLARVGNIVLAATSEGIMVVEAGRVRRYFLDRTTDGNLKVSRSTESSGTR